MKRVFCAFLLTVFITIPLCLIISPFRKEYVAAAKPYVCRWTDGSVTRESYASAFRDYADCTEETILLERNDIKGFIGMGKQAQRIFAALNSVTPLAELLSLDAEQADRLERAALTRKFGRRLWYDGDWFCWEGMRMHRTRTETADETVLISGEVPSGVLKKTQTKTLILGGGAEISANDFCGSAVDKVIASPPYIFSGNALYAESVGGKRLIAALPSVEVLHLEDAVVFEEGALSPCTHIKELSLPFVGNFADGNASSFRGELKYLFGENVQPTDLQSVKVRDGVLVSHAFLGCPSLCTIDVCGVVAENISPSAFLGLDQLRSVHSPRKDIMLNGTYLSYPAPCGCTVFEKAYG